MAKSQKTYDLLLLILLGCLVLAQTAREYLRFGEVAASLPARATVAGKLIGVKYRQSGEVVLTVNGSTDGGIAASYQIKLGDTPWNSVSLCAVGDAIEVNTSLEAVNADDPFSYPAYLLRRGIVATGRANDVNGCTARTSEQQYWRTRLVTALIKQFPQDDNLPITIAVTLGDMSLLGSHITELYRQLGISHLLVISGFHVGFVFFAVFAAARLLLSCFPRLLAFCPAHGPAAVIGLVAASYYTELSGAELPSVRSLVLIVIITGGKILSRQALSWRNLLLSAIAVIVIWPGCFFELSFQLSFAAVLGLAVGNAFAQKLGIGNYDMQDAAALNSLGRKFYKLKSKALLSVFISVGAWAFTLPILLLWFSTFSAVSVLANLIFVPFFTFLYVAIGGVAILCRALSDTAGSWLLSWYLKLADVFMQLLWLFQEFFAGLGLTEVELQPSLAKNSALIWTVVLLAAVYWGQIWNGSRKRIE